MRRRSQGGAPKLTKPAEPSTLESEPAGVVKQAFCWETFFMCQRYPVLRSQMLTTLMAGTPLEAARVPTGALLDAVLIAFAARVYHNAEIVDDWSELQARVEEEWRKPGWSCKTFSNLHGNFASFIMRGAKEFSGSEEQYIPEMVGWFLEHEPPNYFSREIEK